MHDLVGQVAIAEAPLLLAPLAALLERSCSSIQEAPVEVRMLDVPQRFEKGAQTDETVPVRLEQEAKINRFHRETEKREKWKFEKIFEKNGIKGKFNSSKLKKINWFHSETEKTENENL